MSRRIPRDLGDGRTLVAVFEGDEVGWACHLVGSEERAVTGGSRDNVLAELLGFKPGSQPDWVFELGESLTAEEVGARRDPCPCCGYLTLPITDGTSEHEIRPVCFWEHDRVQESDPSWTTGANRVS